MKRCVEALDGLNAKLRNLDFVLCRRISFIFLDDIFMPRK